MHVRSVPARTMTVAAVVLSIVVLAGCSTEPGSTDETGSTTTATDAATPPAPSAAATATAAPSTAPSASPAVPEDPTGTGETPLPNADLQDTFAVLPLPAGTTPRDAPVVEGNTMQQTFRVQGDGPEAVLEDFAPELEEAGWNLTEGIEPRGGGAAATWIRDGLELQLVTQPGPDQASVGLLEVLLRRPG